MKADEFVKQLAAAAPRKEDLLKLGLDSASADNFLKSYDCVKRKAPLNMPTVAGSEDLIDLFKKWNPKGVTIGMVEFFGEPVATPRGLQIGIEEIQPLLISPNDGEIIVEEEGTDGHRLGDVAVNGSKLLDALIVAANFLSKRVAGIVLFDDFNAAKIAANDCAVAAGGERYLRFYINFLGAEE